MEDLLILVEYLKKMQRTVRESMTDNHIPNDMLELFFMEEVVTEAISLKLIASEEKSNNAK